MLAGAALVVLVGAWIFAAVRLWRTSVPDDLDLPHLATKQFFSAAVVHRADDFESFLDVTGLLATLAQVAVLGWYAAKGARFVRESAAGRIGTGILLGMLGFAFVWFAQLPFGLAEQWWLRRHDLSHQGYLEWLVSDWLSVGGLFLFISLAVAIVMGFAALLRKRWWLVGGPALIGVGVAFAFLQPYLIPDLHPVHDAKIRADARALARAEGIDGTPVRVQDVHKETSAPNAEAAGVGPSKRVILWDTLLKRFKRSEVRVVLAHEFGHLSHRHILKQLGWMALLAIPIGAAVQFLTRRRGGLYEPEAVPLAVFGLMAILFILTPLQNAFSRRLEAEADWVALNTTRDPRAATNLFKGFTKIALSSPRPPGWSYALTADHPTVMQRVEMAAAWRARQRTSPEPEPRVERSHCPRGAANCRTASGRILYVERVDPDGDGDAHFVLTGGHLTLPGISVIDVEKNMRPHPLPGPGDLVSAAGPVYRGSYGQRQIQATELHVARLRPRR